MVVRDYIPFLTHRLETGLTPVSIPFCTGAGLEGLLEAAVSPGDGEGHQIIWGEVQRLWGGGGRPQESLPAARGGHGPHHGGGMWRQRATTTVCVDWAIASHKCVWTELSKPWRELSSLTTPCVCGLIYCHSHKCVWTESWVCVELSSGIAIATVCASWAISTASVCGLSSPELQVKVHRPTRSLNYYYAHKP